MFCSLGLKFLCSVLTAPVKIENGDIIMYIIIYEDISDTEKEMKVFPSSKWLRNII